MTTFTDPLNTHLAPETPKSCFACLTKISGLIKCRYLLLMVTNWESTRWSVVQGKILHSKPVIFCPISVYSYPAQVHCAQSHLLPLRPLVRHLCKTRIWLWLRIGGGQWHHRGWRFLWRWLLRGATRSTNSGGAADDGWQVVQCNIAAKCPSASRHQRCDLCSHLHNHQPMP